MELSPEDCRYCQDITKQLLASSLHECEELGLETMHDANLACLDKKRWKKIQSNAEVSVYADRDARAAWLPVMRRQDWVYPVAVTAVGRMDCSLDDVLLALMTQNRATQRLRSFLMDRCPQKNCQILPIETPTQEAPFQFLAVIWFVDTHDWPFTLFKSPREIVMAIATGSITTASGKVFAYELAQPVELQCNPYKNSLVPRSRGLQARIFWKQRDGSIAVYSKVVVDAKYRLSDPLKQVMLSRAVMALWKFVPRSLETKKLWWCVKHKKLLTRELRTHSQPQSFDKFAGCEVKTQRKQVAASRCEFCDKQQGGEAKRHVFSQLKLILSSETGILEQTLLLCQRCAAFVRNQNAADIARAELVEMEQTSYSSSAHNIKKSISQREDVASLASYSSTDSACA